MGETRSRLDLGVTPPVVLMLVGLQGSGKTTSAAKLARHLRDERGRRPYLVPGRRLPPRRDRAADHARDASSASPSTRRAPMRIPSTSRRDAVAAARTQKVRHGDRRHRRPAAHRRRADGRARAIKAAVVAAPRPPRRRRDDRPGRGQRRPGIPRPARRRRRRPHQARRRCPRRRGALDPRDDRRADLLRRRRREARRARAVPSRPHGLAHSRQGRRPVADREGREGLRPEAGGGARDASSARTSSRSRTSAISSRW